MTNIQIGGLQLRYILDNVTPHYDKLWCTSHDQGWQMHQKQIVEDLQHFLAFSNTQSL